MTIHELLSQTSHRPWPVPQHRWQYYQEWNHTVFLHWPVEAERLRQWVPPGLAIDTCKGQGWVSLVAFTMERIRPRLLPHFAPISNFYEVNLRTYVRDSRSSRAGVYFLSMEGSKRLSCLVAKQLSKLPYHFAHMVRSENHFSLRNPKEGNRLKIHFSIKEKLEAKNELDLWLTERYALFQEADGTIHSFDVHHLEWQLQAVELLSLVIDYPTFNPLLEGEPARTHFSPGVQVVAWGKEQHTQ